MFTKTIQLYKDAYTGHPREIWTLFFLTLINRFGTMVFPFLAVYLTTVLGFPLKQTGVLTGTYGLGALAGAYLGGKFSDKYGTRIIIITSLLISGCTFIFLQFATSFSSLFVLIFITSLFGEAYRPAVMSAVGGYVPENQTGRSMSLIRMAISIGMSLAPAIGGFVAITLGYNWLFWIDGSTCIIAALYFWAVSRNWMSENSCQNKSNTAEENLSEKAAYKNRNFLLFLLATFIMGFGFIQWFHTIPVFIKSEWGYDERYIGVLMAIGSAMIVLFELPSINAIERAGKIKTATLLGLLLISVSFLIFLFPKALLFCFIALIIVTLGGILYFPFNNSIPLSMSPVTKRGEYMAWYWMIWALTNIAGPIIGFALIDELGYATFWLVLSSLVGISFMLNFLFAKKIIR